MTHEEVVKCKCKWLGYALATCTLHEGVVLSSGIHLTKGKGYLQAGETPVRKGAAGQSGIYFKGSMENLDLLRETCLERVVKECFPRRNCSARDRMYLNRGPDTFWVKDTEERAKLFPKGQLASESGSLRGRDLLLDCASLIRLMLAVRGQLVTLRVDSKTFKKSFPVGRTKDGDACDWYTTVSGELNSDGFVETLEIKLLVRDGPVVTRKGSEGQPIHLGATTRPVAEKLYQHVVFSVVLDVGAVPYPIRGISVDIAPGTESPVVTDIREGTLIRPSRARFLEGAVPGKLMANLLGVVSTVTKRKGARVKFSKQ